MRLCSSCASITFSDIDPGNKFYFDAEPLSGKDSCNLCSLFRGCYLENLRVNLHYIYYPPKKELKRTTPQHLIQLQINKVTLVSDQPHCNLLVTQTTLLDTWYGDEVKKEFYFHNHHFTGECGLERHPSGPSRALTDTSYRVLSAWADLALARTWVRECNIDHDNCQPIVPAGTAEALHPSTRLIDTKLKRLVTLEEIITAPLEFVALSYVWGNDYQLRLTSQTIREFRKRLPSDNNSAMPRLPRTIRDTMKVTRALGYRFLWVDALCIVQDSPDDLEIQLAQMDHIYGLAAVTIVARASKSSDSGLPGVSIPRNWLNGENLTSMVNWGLHVGCLEALDSEYEVYEEKYGELADKACYMWRGWTFQEQILSTRALEFNRRRLVFWCGRPLPVSECGAASGRDMRDPHHFRSAIRKYKQTNGALPPDMDPKYPWKYDYMTRDMLLARWCTIRENFSTRHFTHLSDRRNAVLGTASMLRSVIGDVDSSGHVTSQLGNELLWHMTLHPGWNPSQTPLISFSPNPVPAGMFPSWSWMSLWPLTWSSDNKPFPGVDVRINHSDGSCTLEIQGPSLKMSLVKMSEAVESELVLAYRDGTKSNIELHLDRPLEVGADVRCAPLASTIYASAQWYAWCYGMMLLQPFGLHYERIGVGFVREDDSDIFMQRIKSDEAWEGLMICL